MLLRDLLVALPGLIGPTGTSSRVEELEVQKSSQVVTPAAETSAQAGFLTGTASSTGTFSSRFMEKALQDFQNQAGYQLGSQPPAATEPEDAELPGNDTDSGEGDTGSGQDGSDQGGSGQADAENTLPNGTPIALNAQTTVMAGRVATLLPDDDGGQIASVRILGNADWGHVSVNPDNSLALVLSGTEQKGALSFRYEVTCADGHSEELTATVKVTDGQQQAGWGTGDHYVLETDADGRSIVEHGDIHREVYVSASRDALSLQDIAKLEGLQVSAIDGRWLADHAEYGSSADMALDETAGMALWNSITGSKAGPSSHWLRLESGYTYDEVGFLVKRGTQGESALNPVMITSYGEGDRPVIAQAQDYNTPDNANIVIRGLSFTDGLQIIQGKNYLLEDLGIRNETLVVKEVDGITFRNSDVIDVFRTQSNSEGLWQPHINRISGVFANSNDGLLIENNFVDHTGWADNYKPNLSLSGGQPPSIYSQGLYLSYDNTDLTLRDNILMRNASFGAQVRSGGVIENNLFLDNNAALNILGGDDMKTHNDGNYTLMMGNVVTSGAHRDVTEGPRGALTMGVDNSGRMTTMIDNIITHMADPNNDRELAQKQVGHKALSEKFAPFYSDTIIYNWVGARNADDVNSLNQAVGQLDSGILDETTIQNFTAQLLGKSSATIADLANHLRAQADGKLDGHVDADIINSFFRTGFGLDTVLRDEAGTLRFVPNDLADGIRWDNRLNWSTGDLPGTQDGDSVDLGGNHVRFGGQTVTVDDFIFGDFGTLTATSGRLTINGDVSVGKTGGVLEIDRAGQVWMDSYRDSDLLDIDVQGGRFVNAGTMTGGLDLTVSDDGRAILAGSDGRLVLGSDSSLTLEGSKAKAGFDGSDNGTAVLRLEQGSALNFVADAQSFSQIAEFRSGAFGDDAKVHSGVVLDGLLQIDVADLRGLDAQQDSRWTLMQADEIIGNFDNLQIDGLGSRQDALLRIDYDADTVVLALSAQGKGTGRVRVVTDGIEDFHGQGDKAADLLWDEMHLTL